MTIFAILLPSPQPQLEEAIKQTFPKDHLSINDTQWLISASCTVVELTARLGIFDNEAKGATPTGSAVVLAVSSYYGRAPAMIWDWMRAKLEVTAGV